MRISFFCSTLTLAASAVALTLPLQAQSKLTATSDPGTAATLSTTTAWRDTVIPSNKQLTARVKDGVLMVDGFVAKVQLNYDIHHAGYLYFFVPGVGTALVSRADSIGATRVKNAFNGSTLAFTAGGHSFVLSSKSPLLGGSGKSDVYVHLDASTLALDCYPMVGFGSTTRAPYIWPLSGPASKDTTAHFVTPPPLPPSILPRTAASEAALQTAALTTQPQPKQ